MDTAAPLDTPMAMDSEIVNDEKFRKYKNRS
jgi:hypothetical protein